MTSTTIVLGEEGEGSCSSLPSPSNPPTVIYHQPYPSPQLVSVFMDIIRRKKTGSLTINFNQGQPSGTIDWREKISISDFDMDTPL